MSGARVVFVDRDGVVNDLVPDPESGLPESPLSAADVALMPGAAGALGRLAGAGYLLAGASNQPAAAKGTVPIEDLRAVQARVEELLADEGVAFDAFEICFHHPDGVVPELAGACDCRKPAPGMLLKAAAALGGDLPRSWMIGDTDSDAGAAEAAGCRYVRVAHPGSAHKRQPGTVESPEAGDLAGAADLLLAIDFDPRGHIHGG